MLEHAARGRRRNDPVAPGMDPHRSLEALRARRIDFPSWNPHPLRLPRSRPPAPDHDFSWVLDPLTPGFMVL